MQAPLASNEFVSYVDGIGELDGKRCLIEWKTSSARYPEQPEGLLALDPQLVCYSWMTGISEVAQIVFVRKRLVDIQYLRTIITDEQRQEFGHLVEDTIRRIKPRSSCHTAASAFRKTLASLVPTLDFVWGKRILPCPRSFGVQESKTLVGLTSLLTSNPPMPPKLNRQRALFVLAKIDEILGLGAAERGRARHQICGARTVSLRSPGGTVLEVGECEIL